MTSESKVKLATGRDSVLFPTVDSAQLAGVCHHCREREAKTVAFVLIRGNDS